MSEPNPRSAQATMAILGEIALEVAHELRNLLLVIDGTTYVAKQSATACACGPHLAKIDRTVRAARGVVDDVFLLAAEEPVPREPVALAHVVDLARRELGEHVTRGSEPVWVDSFAAREVVVRAHDRLLARALKVLYENAIQMRSPESVRIETRIGAVPDRPDMLAIEIEDDGAGVAAGIADRIFEPLVSARPGGSGMGLPLARRVMLAHGGEIVLADAPGPSSVLARRGACFRLLLPI